MMSYSSKIDQKWQKRWDEQNLAAFNRGNIKQKLYVLEMFSYPSAAKLHIGHWWNYSLVDSWARMKKMQGYEIFQPMGFDAFGLPAENYAIKTGIHPKDSTYENIERMEEQLRKMGAMFNWEHELSTCKPDYYKWNQWLFLQLYEKGLAYRKKAPVNWCDSCQTVLANEQVMGDGTCERCQNLVSKKNLTQWFFKITDYAQELLDGLEDLNWPEKTKKIQSHWIGRSDGAEIVFEAEKDGQKILREDGSEVKLRVFTTRADTLLGVSYVVVAPDSELCDLLTTDGEAESVRHYQEESRHVSEIDRMSSTREKSGVFTGSYAVHPVSGEKVPVWTADYVIGSYGTGVVMAVPAHDERDFEFAHKFNLPVRRVIQGEDGEEKELPFVEDGKLCESGPYDGLSSEEARLRIVEDLAKSGQAEMKINYRLRDWLVSRQRYWGTPIPIIYCPECGTVPVPEEDLPVELPYDVKFTPDGDSPLKSCESFIHTTCPKCGGPAEREADTLDTFVDSSWYMFRYVDNRNDEKIFDSEKVNAMCPVDMYVGGPEHAAMHLLYARFISKAMRDMGLINFDEPFTQLVHQGIILGSDGNKMSKSKGNTVNPDDYIRDNGSDIFRLYLAFGFAYTEGGPWSDNGLKAIVRFVARLETLVETVKDFPSSEIPADQDLTSADRDLLYSLHYTIQQVTQDADRFQFNTSVARMMELLNACQAYQQTEGFRPALLRHTVEVFMLLIAPFAPHFAEEQAEILGSSQSVFLHSWPQVEENYLVKNEIEIAVQVNGRIVERMMVPADADKDLMLDLVRQDSRYEGWLGGRTEIKAVAVPGRLVNIVVK